MNVRFKILFRSVRIQALPLAAAVFFTCLSNAAAAQGTLPFFSSYPDIDQNRWHLSHGWTNGPHQSCEWRAEAVSGKNARLRLRLSDKGGALRPVGCAEIQSQEYFGYGRYEARMRTAAGSGLNTAFFTYIGPPLGVADHDEIDFEFLGKDPHEVEITFHKAGKKHEAIKVPLGFDASAGFHDYAFEWRPDDIRWYVDGRLVYQTPDGTDVPDNPGKIFFSLWSGSKELNDWLGPFNYQHPVTAEIAWVRFIPLEKLEAADERW